MSFGWISRSENRLDFDSTVLTVSSGGSEGAGDLLYANQPPPEICVTAILIVFT